MWVLFYLFCVAWVYLLFCCEREKGGRNRERLRERREREGRENQREIEREIER